MKKMLCLLLFTSWPAFAVELPAVLQWSQRVELSPLVSGRVSQIAVEPGQSVRRGQLLLRVDAGAQQAAVQESAANVRSLQEQAAEAKRDLARTQELYDRSVISTTELDQAKLRAARANADVAAARARVAQGQSQVRDSVVTAPFDAIVVARNVEPGQHIVVNLKPEAAVVVARAGEMIARTTLDAQQIGKVTVGQSADVLVDGKRYAGRIKTLALEPSSLNGRSGYAADIVFKMPGVLRAGLPAKVNLAL